MNNKFLKSVVLIFLAVGLLYVFFISSVMDLVNTKDLQKVSVSASGDLLTVENSINGIIPTGKDYYYVCQKSDTNVLYAIHADKHWLNNNFDVNGIANGGNVDIKGLTKRASDFEVEKEIAYRMGQIVDSDGLGVFEQALTPGFVLELNYIQDAILKIISGIVLLIVGTVFYIYEKKTDMFPAWAGKPLVALIFVALAFALWTII